MALDGIFLSAVLCELNDKLLNGRIDKVYQPEKDEVLLLVRSQGTNYKLLLTANPTHPRLHFVTESKENPKTAPLFSMVLRKHLSGGKIIEIVQPEFERIAFIKIESMNEMGDASVKTLVLEIMGKHSNIILLDENNKIIDSVKHINFETSSVREVLPGKSYFIPSQGKLNPMDICEQEFIDAIASKQNDKLQSAIYTSITGISPLTASEILERAHIDASTKAVELSDTDIKLIYSSFSEIMNNVKLKKYCPFIIYDSKGSVFEFIPFRYEIFKNNEMLEFADTSKLLEHFYSAKDLKYRILQKSADLRKVVSNHIERCVKKKDVQLKTIDDTKEKDIWKLKGELITAYIYTIEKGMREITVQNFYDENLPDITIALDKDETPSENAQRYFKKYNKAKRTLDALETQIQKNEEELLYLESVLTGIENSTCDGDLTDIRNELCETGFLKRKAVKKNLLPKKSMPIEFLSSDGFSFFAGKNNAQNDELTMHFAKSNDMWFHCKNIPGSHVILKTEGRDITETAIIEAASICAFYSKSKIAAKIPVDYTLKKNVKKPSGAKPGFVIYDNYSTVYVTPEESLVKKLKVN